MSARWFHTEYTLYGPEPGRRRTYAAQLWALNLSHAATIAARRNIGEVVKGYGPQKKESNLYDWQLPSSYVKYPHLRNQNKLKLLHSLQFLCWVGVQSGALTPAEALDDSGIVHETLHWFLFGSPDQEEMLKRIIAVEMRVPGFSPYVSIGPEERNSTD